MRRAEAAGEAEGQVEAQHGEADGGQRFADSDQQFGLAVCAGSVRERDGGAVRLRGRVQKAANGGVGGGVVEGREHEWKIAEETENWKIEKGNWKREGAPPLQNSAVNQRANRRRG
jgi:hypothetical protein